MDYDFYGFESEEDYLDSLKKDDSYSFSIPFDYIAKNHGNDNCEMATAYMDVCFSWDPYEHGYRVSYGCSEENKIDPSQGNGDIESFYTYAVEPRALEKMYELGFEPTALYGGVGR